MNKEKDLSTEYAEQEAEREQELKEEYANSTSRAVAILRKVGREADAEELEEKAWEIEEDWITELEMRKADKEFEKEQEKKDEEEGERIEKEVEELLEKEAKQKSVTGEMENKIKAITEILDKIVRGKATPDDKNEARRWAKELVIQIEEIRENQEELHTREILEDEENISGEEMIGRGEKMIRDGQQKILDGEERIKEEENDRMIKEANEMRTEDQIEEEKNNEETSRIREQQIIKEREE